jgi:hypothetical protein
MFAAGFEFSGFSVRDWRRLVGLFPTPLPTEPAIAVPGARGLVVVAQGERLLGIYRAGRGTALPGSIPWPSTPEELASRLCAPWVVSLHASALLEVQERFGARIRATDSIQDQWVKLLVAVQELVNESRIDVWPKPGLNWPLLLQDYLAQSALELLCPPGKCLVLGVFQEGQLYTGLVLRRAADAFDLAMGPDSLREKVGLLSGDWFRDYPHLVAVVQREVGPVAGGCFAEASCIRRLFSARKPGALTQAVATRELVIDPVSPALAVSLGIDVGRVAFAGIQSLTQRLARVPWANPQTAQRMTNGAAGDLNLEAVIGFDPIAAIGKLILDAKHKN